MEARARRRTAETEPVNIEKGNELVNMEVEELQIER